MFEKYKHIHFIGIGGIGMSGIAEVLLTLGYEVSGSDLKAGMITSRLRRHGAHISRGHRALNIAGADVVVISSAVKENNVEVQAAKKSGIQVISRADMLAELMRLKYAVAVAGTHGKTSTTSIIATIFYYAGFDPTMIIGGKVNSFRTNAKLGRGDFLVAEADESDRSFLRLSPTIAVITNIDPEHMENYRNFDHMKESYVEFANKVPFYGSVVTCIDHPEVRNVVKKIERRCVTYALDREADFTATDIRQVEDRLQFMVCNKGKKLGAIRFNMVGRHNVANALAAVAVAVEAEIPFPKIASAFTKFRGIERRFQMLRRGPGPVIVSDYCHHPVEIAAVIKSARDGWPEKRVVFIHQPHRYTRLRTLFKDFVKVLGKTDRLALLPIYAAGEKPQRGIGSRQLYTSLKRHYPRLEVDLIKEHDLVLKWVKENAGFNDIVIFSGAGDIGRLAQEVARAV